MHRHDPTEDSLLEADGLAEFAAARSARGGASTRSSGGGGASVYDGMRSEGYSDGYGTRRSAEEEHQPHSPPARYDPDDVPLASPRSSFPSARGPPTQHYQPYAPYSPPQAFPPAPHFAPPSLPPPSLHARSDPPPSVARPPLPRTWGNTWRSAPTYAGIGAGAGRRDSYAPDPQAYPFPSPPPPFPGSRGWAAHDPYARGGAHGYEAEYEAGDEFAGRGDLGAARSAWGGGAESEEDDEADEEKHPAARTVEGEWTAPAGGYLHGVGFDGAHLASGAAAQDGGKAERRRERLERRFGSSALSALGARGQGRTAQEDATGVDSAGRLLTQGRRKRLFLRWTQALLALVVGAGAIGAAFTHPDPKPAPTGSAPHWALIVLPFLSLALSTYCFAVRPCLVRRRAQEAPGGQGGMGMGMGVYPLLQPQPQQQGGGGGFFGGGGGGQKGKYAPPGAGMSVNLVVDPRFLPGFALGAGAGAAEGGEVAQRRREKRRRKKKRREERRRRRAVAARGAGAADEESSSSSSLSSSDGDERDPPDAWTAATSSPNPRHALLSHLSHESAWRSARAWAARVLALDGAACALWGGVGIWAIGWAGKCPPGGGKGFCNLFNTAVAGAVLESVAFGASFALGCFDLSRAKVSPR
ncbi:hypothetical protein JCM10450v2_006377 [Rhodotorula kratochvilovae]